MTDITSESQLVIHESGDIIYPITVGINRKLLYTAAISIVSNKGFVQDWKLNFSELILVSLIFHL